MVKTKYTKIAVKLVTIGDDIVRRGRKNKLTPKFNSEPYEVIQKKNSKIIRKIRRWWNRMMLKGIKVIMTAASTTTTVSGMVTFKLTRISNNAKFD